MPGTHTFSRRISCCAAALLLAASARAQAPNTALESKNQALAYRDQAPLRAKNGMVISVHHEASDAGHAILQQGGNAVDAAVATGFALAVVYPVAGNLGGGGFMLFRSHSGATHFLDFREKAPYRATETMYQDEHGQILPGASTVGYRAIATPGSVAGLVYAEKKFGRLTLARVMQPAITLAEQGYTLSADEARMLTDARLAGFADSHRIFQRDGNFYQDGERFRQPELARTLRRIAKNPSDFYRGAMARELIQALDAGHSLLTLRDLREYKVVERRPLVGHYQDDTILSAPPPSSGGIALIATLNILEGYDLTGVADRSAPWLHLLTEAYRRAYMDRSDYLGDPDFNPIPIRQMISKDYAAAWRASIDAHEATASASLARPAGFLPPPPATAGSYKESTDTTHYSVVDKQGNAVAVTTTLNGPFGSYVTAGPLGFLLNDEMDDFSAKAGARIITTVGNIFLSAAQGGLNIQQAVDAPRFHMQYQPDKLYLEPGFDDAVVQELRGLYYEVVQQKNGWSDGECIAIDPVTGDKLAGHDHRHHFGSASGY